jgi:hypothetical protein
MSRTIGFGQREPLTWDLTRIELALSAWEWGC